MPRRSKIPHPSAASAVLGIEAGGTRTSVILATADHKILAEFQTGPAVLPLMSDRELQWQLREIAARLPQAPAAIGIGMAGARSAADKDRLHRAASRIWPHVPCLATNDLETALAAAPETGSARPHVLVLSGTGSCCFGRDAQGRTAKVGGRGHVIGDRASACDIGLRALRAVMADLDQKGKMGALGTAMLNALTFNEPEQLIPWSVQASKTEIASLAVTVFTVAGQGDRLARNLLAESAGMLAEDAVLCARQLTGGKEEPVTFVMNGGVLLKDPTFLQQVSRLIRKQWPKAKILPLHQSSVWGAVHLAQSLVNVSKVLPSSMTSVAAAMFPAEIADLAVLAKSPTERRNPISLRLDRISLSDGIDLMLSEDATLPAAIRQERKAITRLIAEVVSAFQNSGRLFYVGAGTSGRLGVLDASEIPPTFRAPREQVQGIIAGGRQALWSAVEGAEDDAHAGAQAVAYRSISKVDVVVGIAASGRTPFVWGALREAKKRGAFTCLLCFNPAMKKAAAHLKDASWKPALMIAPDLGPEVLTGSTRLKSGTATKLILNMVTTLAMTRAGKVISNLMVDVNPSNVKLRDRAVRIISELTNATSEQAREALARSGWVVKKAYQMLSSKAR
jgi:N-acetylmuramic acid 6-phosphate etherase